MNKFSNNITLKIFSLFIALTLWVVTIVGLDPVIKRTLNIGEEVSVRGINTQAYDVDIQEEDITVELEGNRSKVLSILERDIVLYVDLEGYEEGEHIVKLDMDKNSKFNEVDTTIVPKEIKINIEKIIKIDKEVEIKKEGKLKEGLNIEKLKIENEKIYISGKRSLIESIDRVYSELDLSRVSENNKVSFPIKVFDKSGKEIENIIKSQENIVVTINGYNSGTTPIEILTSGELPENLELESIVSQPSYVNILYKNKSIEEIKKIQTEKIDLRNIKENTELTVKLVAPEGIEIVDVNSVKVKIRVKPKELEDEIVEGKTTINISDINIIGLRENLVVDFNSMERKSVDVFLRGTKEAVESAKNSIRLEGDFSVVTVKGENSIVVTVTGVPESEVSWRINPNIVAFVIKEKSDI